MNVRLLTFSSTNFANKVRLALVWGELAVRFRLLYPVLKVMGVKSY